MFMKKGPYSHKHSQQFQTGNVILISLSHAFYDLYGVFLAFGMGVAINFSTYRFFWKIRGFWFALTVIPLHGLYHLCNGASVIGALLYRCFIDKPLPGLKTIGAKLQELHWRYVRLRRDKKRNSIHPSVPGNPQT